MLFLSLIFLQLAVFAVLVFFLRVVFRRNVSAATAHLHELNQDYTHKLDDARKKQAEAEKYFEDTILRAKSEEKPHADPEGDARTAGGGPGPGAPAERGYPQAGE